MKPEDYNREDGMEYTRSCPMLQVGVKGENGMECKWNIHHDDKN